MGWPQNRWPKGTQGWESSVVYYSGIIMADDDDYRLGSCHRHISHHTCNAMSGT